MLPGLGFSEIVVLGIIALLVVGPKDLPLMMRKLGRWLARLRGMAQEFRSGFDELARQAELDELKREVEALRRHSSFSGLVNEITRPVDLSPLPETPAPRATLARPERTYDPSTVAAPSPAPAPASAETAGEASGAAEPELPFEVTPVTPAAATASPAAVPAAKTGEAP
ncbi:MAG: Sec-independent protein translocase protein TatB [Alphaproteobacteria bacterium]|nr:Sec-independent protein translocase protein TatB [Alphaproteobacteria bacterium]